MADHAFKKIQLVGTSSKSLTEAVANAVSKAAEIEPQSRWFEVVEQRGSIVDGKVQQYQVTVNIGVRID